MKTVEVLRAYLGMANAAAAWKNQFKGATVEDRIHDLLIQAGIEGFTSYKANGFWTDHTKRSFREPALVLEFITPLAETDTRKTIKEVINRFAHEQGEQTVLWTTSTATAQFYDLNQIMEASHER